MYVSVGSHSNNDDPDTHPEEKYRADILEFNPDGSGMRIFAWGLRNAVGIAVNPLDGELWASTNERDELGDNLPPDYITARERRWILRMAMVLHGRSSRPETRRQTSRVESQSHYS